MALVDLLPDLVRMSKLYVNAKKVFDSNKNAGEALVEIRKIEKHWSGSSGFPVKNEEPLTAIGVCIGLIDVAKMYIELDAPDDALRCLIDVDDALFNSMQKLPQTVHNKSRIETAFQKLVVAIAYMAKAHAQKKDYNTCVVLLEDAMNMANHMAVHNPSVKFFQDVYDDSILLTYKTYTYLKNKYTKDLTLLAKSFNQLFSNKLAEDPNNSRLEKYVKETEEDSRYLHDQIMDFQKECMMLVEQDLVELEQAKREALPEGEFQVGDMMYKASENRNGVTVCGLVNKDATKIHIPSQIKYGKYTYEVTSIGEEAFGECSGLTSITIPNSVTSIGNEAFGCCSGLTSITIPNSVTCIGEYAFGECSGLTSITIPNSVTSIGEGAFGSCSSLTSITIPNSVTSIGENAFYGCKSLTSITIPNSVASIGENAFMSCSGLTSITIPNSVASIGSYAFCDCSGLTSITIPNSVTCIGEYVFANCSSLTSITIPNSVTSIGEGAFAGCIDLEFVNIPRTLTDIHLDAFPAHTTVRRSLLW